MPDRLDLAIRITYVALYAAVVASFLLIAFPGARTRLAYVGRSQLYRWRVGVHRSRTAPPPAFVRHLTRNDLPDEPAA